MGKEAKKTKQQSADTTKTKDKAQNCGCGCYPGRTPNNAPQEKK